MAGPAGGPRGPHPPSLIGARGPARAPPASRGGRRRRFGDTISKTFWRYNLPCAGRRLGAAVVAVRHSRQVKRQLRVSPTVNTPVAVKYGPRSWTSANIPVVVAMGGGLPRAKRRSSVGARSPHACRPAAAALAVHEPHKHAAAADRRAAGPARPGDGVKGERGRLSRPLPWPAGPAVVKVDGCLSGVTP